MLTLPEWPLLCTPLIIHWVNWHTVGLFWVPGHSGVQGNEATNKLAKDRTVQLFVGPEPNFWLSRQNIRRTIKWWKHSQYMVMWWGLTSTQRWAQELILGPGPTKKTRLLSCNRTQSRVIAGLLTVHNAPRNHLYLTGMINTPLCRFGAKEETSAHILWVRGSGFTLTCIFAFLFLGPRGLQILSLAAIWNCRNRAPMTWHHLTCLKA
jgi:hypothetical protein